MMGGHMSPLSATTDPRTTQTTTGFQNPIAPGADPWVVRHDGWYYWCLSENMLGVGIYRSRSLAALGERVAGWRAPETGPHCAEIWAPELHRVDGSWYVYVAASSGTNATHRMIVLEAEGEHPTGDLRYKAELYLGDDLAGKTDQRWAIDATLLEHQGRRYVIWSGWEDARDEQWLYIAPLSNPWTVAGNRVRICANDDFRWERVSEDPAQRGLNEAPQVLQRDGRVFVIFSASGSWEVSYKLGMLELLVDGDPLNPKDWIKHAQPVFQSTDHTWGVGHCSFTQSPDGTEDWMAFHAKRDTNPSWDRVIHVQPFAWDPNGRPVFGQPTDAGTFMKHPAGETDGSNAVAVLHEAGRVLAGSAT
jgi:GH43 family beta-xylosidase